MNNPNNNPNNEKTKASPEERVDKMNGIFDRLILPMILFTLAVFVIFGLIPKLGSCSCSPEPDVTEQPAQTDSTQTDFYALRAVLLDDIEEYRALFEAAGYTVMQTDESSMPLAYRQLDSGAEIIDNLYDSGNTCYSVIYRTDADNGIETNIMIYGRSLFLVMITVDGQNTSAVFYSEDFTAAVSPADTAQTDVLSLVTSESLAALLGEYKTSMSQIFEQPEE